VVSSSGSPSAGPTSSYPGRLLLSTLLFLSACSASTSTAPTSAPSAPSTSGHAVVSTTHGETTTSVPTTSTTTIDDPIFQGSIDTVDQKALGHSWREGCPVDPADLRTLTLSFWGFDSTVQTGALIIHVEESEAVLEVFETLFTGGYPIQSVTPIGDLPDDAEESPDYSNTSAFNCRFIEGTERWSEHAFGLAIDLNPHLNPYVEGSYTWPSAAEKYRDRTLGEPGMIVDQDDVVRAFGRADWKWGGNWSTVSDYHHFSKTGR
jgi:hypothetical protein